MAAAPFEDRLIDLLIQWEESRRQGPDLRAEDLCSDCPELVEELRHRIEAVRAMGPVIGAETMAQRSTPWDSECGDGETDHVVPDVLRASAVYRPQHCHARGGQGVVLAAHQEELDRTVALKRIRPEMLHVATRRHRFLREAAITAQLQHPGIVPIYGLGEDNGGPFYSMPLIEGRTLEEAIEAFHNDDSLRGDAGKRSLKFRGLLQQFIAVCNTIAYAHDQGVIHRDLKPLNIMLGPYGETLVMDWGLAKRFGRDDQAAESGEDGPSPSPSPEDLTATGAVLGTPRYMSSEQAKGEPTGPASDIFSLGLILYAIMTGKPAFDGDSLRGADPLKAVREADILPPRIREASLSRALEAVCLKALAASPEDRYESARALAEDVTRWLADEPVSQWREPLSLRVRRWIRTHRTIVITTAAVVVFGVVGLLGFVTILTTKNRELEGERRTAVDERNNALEAKRVAVNEEARARQSAVETKTLLEFFQERVLAAARAKDRGGLGRDATIRAAVDAAEPEIARSFSEQPAVEASIRDTMGETYYHVGVLALAIPQFERALALRRLVLGPNHRDTLMSMNNLATTYQRAGRVSDALPLDEEALKQRRRELGQDHPETLQSMKNLGIVYEEAGRLADAITLQEETLRRYSATLGPDNVETLGSMHNLANAYQAAGRLADALSLHEQTLKRRFATLGPDHRDTLSSMNGLATAYRATGRLAEALPLYKEALKRQEVNLGPGHPNTLTSMGNLASAYREAGRLADALALHKETLERRQAALGPDHPQTLTSMNNLALTYQDAGRLAEALSLFEEAFKRLNAKLGPDHPSTLTAMVNLATRNQDSGRVADALPLFQKAFKGLNAKLGPDHPSTLTAMNHLARA